MKLVALHHDDQNAALFDPWSLIHLSAGLFAGLVGIGVVPSMIAAVAYEGFEQLAESQPWGQKIFKTSGSETFVNIVSDVALFAVGWYLGERYNRPSPTRAINPPRPRAALSGMRPRI